MTDHTKIAMTPRERFMQLAQEQMSEFERRETEFRKKERKEREAALHLPFPVDELH
ncbi:hypothetical protein [Rhodopseudomonas sp. RCAM05734]|uniref:hypothetical protein n=1 Tax=Rhodopseudomonas sp. RCAM05734 TaxID=3457549 RepID=UPI0040445AEA